MRTSTAPSASRRRLGFVVLVASALALAGCSSPAPGPSPTDSDVEALEPTFTLAEEGYLTISTYGSNPPVNIDNPDGTLSGIQGDLLNSFAAKYGIEVKLAPTTFSSMILEVQQGRGDMGLFVYHTEERAETLYYTSALLSVPAVVFTLDDFDYDGPESLEGSPIGVIVGQVWADYVQQDIGGDALLFQSQPQAAQALLNGQIDGYITGLTQMYNPPLSENQDSIMSHAIEDGDWGMPSAILQNTGYNVVSCDNPELAIALDEHLADLIESGEWASIFSALPEEFAVDEAVPPTQGC